VIAPRIGPKAAGSSPASVRNGFSVSLAKRELHYSFFEAVHLKILIIFIGLTVAAMALFLGAVYPKYGSICLRCGILPNSKDDYLDGSRRLFQRCGWHLGDGTYMWGTTYGIKVDRAYLSMQVTHIDPRRTAEEAKD
jgi:hypothetical protein